MKKEGKRILSLILSLLMIISMQSFSMTMAFADDETGEITKQEAAAAETRKAAPESNEDQVEEQETTPGEEAQEPVMKKEPQAVDSVSGDENEPASDPAPEDEDKPATESASDPDAAPAAQMQPKSVKSSAALLGSEPTRNGNTVNMKVSSLGHGTVKVNGTDYGTEFQGTWPEGTEVSAEAVPDSGYKFNKWWIKSTPSNRGVTTASTTLVAGTDTEAEASFGRETASVTITAPAAGTTAATAPQVSMPSGVGYTLDTNTELHGPNVRWVKAESLYPYPEALDSSTVFEAGKTYYAYARLSQGTDSFAATAGGSSFNTELQVTGGTKSAQSNFAATTSSGGGYAGIEAIIAVTIPEATTHTVTFNTQGGTPVAAQTVNDGAYATKPANPSKNGFYFKGWYEKPGSELTRTEFYNNEFKFADTAITEDKTLYAVWYAGFYGATYDLSAATPKYAETGGDVTFTSTYQQKDLPGKVWWDYSIVEGSEVTVTATPAEGARFVGWAPGTLDSNENMPDDPAALGDIVSTDNTYTFTFNGRTALAALFEPEAPSYELSFAFTNLYPGAQPQTLVKSLTVNGEDWTPTSGNITAKDIPAGSSVTATVKVTDNASIASYNNPDKTIADLVPAYSDDGSELTFTFTMPEKDARIVVYLFEAVTVTYDANGGMKTDAWTDFVKWMKYTASQPATINVSQELYDPYSAELRVEPPAGAKFAGIEVTQNKTGAKVTGAPETVLNNIDFSEGGTIKFLWEKLPTLTLHASSVEGDDFVDPIVIPVEKGTTIAQALEQYKSGTSLATELFQVDGYEDYGYRTPKPMSDYSSYSEMWTANVKGSDAIDDNMDIYYSMLITLDSAELTIEPPVCGTSTEVPEGGRPWMDQTNPPVVSTPAGMKYHPYDADGLAAIWVDKEDNPYTGTFVGGNDYFADAWIKSDYGYMFTKDATLTVKGGEVVKPWYDGDYYGALIKVTAVHDWGEWKVVKEPTTTEEGLEERACKHCDEKETRSIAKVVYSCTKGDGSVYTKGSGKDLKFTFERSYKDEETFIRAQKILVDGASVAESNYELSSGSLNVALMSDYLDTLAVGDHTITAVFNDAEVPAEFSVVEIHDEDTATDDTGSDKSAGKKTKSASTGDENDIASMLILMLISGIMLAYVGMKRKYEK